MFKKTLLAVTTVIAGFLAAAFMVYAQTATPSPSPMVSPSPLEMSSPSPTVPRGAPTTGLGGY